MISQRHKQFASIWLAIAAAVYALVRFVAQYSEIKKSWEAFFGPGAWEATTSIVVTGILVLAPVLVAYLAYRGVRSWWLLILLAGSLFAAPSVLVALSIVAVVIWLVDRSDRVTA